MKSSGVVADGKRVRGIRKCAVLKCREVHVFTGATPMLYHIWHCHANDAKSAEEFLTVLLDLSAVIYGSTKEEPAISSFDKLKRWIEGKLGKVDWKFSCPLLEVANNVSKVLKIGVPSKSQLADINRGRISHKALLGHPRLIAIGINEVDKLKDCRPGRTQKEEDDALNKGHGPQKTKPELRTIEVTYSHWHPGKMPSSFVGGFYYDYFRDKRKVDVPVVLAGGCVVYGLGETVVPMNLKGNWVVAQGIHPKEAPNAKREDVFETVALCRKNGWAVGEIGLDYSIEVGHRQQTFILAEFFRRADLATNLVLHLRRTEKDIFRQAPIQDCITLLDGLDVLTLVPIYLHCFAGGPKQVDLWMATGRPVYFGVSGKFRTLTAVQLGGIKAIIDERILIKTDSPYLPIRVPFPMRLCT